MKIVLASLLAAVAAAGTVQMEYISLDDTSLGVEARFEHFVDVFEKDYESIEKTLLAAEAFASNDEIIRKHNAGNSTFTLGHNEFSDLTWPEFKALYVTGMAANPALRREKNYDHTLKTAPADDSVDWVAKGAVTPIKNQGQCGSCWAFSTTGSTEGAYEIATGTLLSLSEQNLVDCASSFGNQGCNGGLMDNGFKYIEKNGIAAEAGYPYLGKTDPCDKAKDVAVVTVTGYTDVPPKSTSALKAAVTKAPVSVAIEADKSAFQLYKSGVFTSASCGTQLDHGVLVVGYGVETGKNYRQVKNSWGKSWGAKGFILIESGHNLCGITQSASYPTGAKKASPSPGPAPGPTPPPAPPAPPSGKTHYGNPANGCMADEQAVKVQGLAGSFCSPDCASAACPTDVPAGVTAAPQCALKSATGDKKCALICSPTTDEASLRAGDAMCGKATCQAISGTGICTYGAGPAPGPSPTPPPPAPPAGKTHYGDPANGCEADEQAVKVQGLSGSFCSPDCASAACPTDIPAGVTAAPQCALKSATGDKKCALVCSPSTDEASLRAGDAMCGKATCQAISGTGICTYGGSPGPSPGPSKCTLESGIECAIGLKECLTECKAGAGACIKCLGSKFATCCPCILKLDPKLPITCGSVAPMPAFMAI